MPRRTNEFQALVFTLTRQLQPLGARVIESGLLTDKTNGSPREVDIVVEVRSGPHLVLLCLECYSGQRPATVEWVERMHGKHQALNTNKLVLVSRRGFSRSAARTARSYGHEALKVCDAVSLDWKSCVDTIPHLGVRATILPQIRKVLIDVPEPDRQRAQSIVNFRQLTLREPGGCQPIVLWKYVECLLHEQRFTDDVVRALPPNKKTLLKGTIALKSGCEVIDAEVGAFPIRSIYFEAEAELVESSFPIERYAFGEQVKVALGRGKINQFPITMSVAHEKGGEPSVRVHLQSTSGDKQLELLSGRLVAEP